MTSSRLYWLRLIIGDPLAVVLCISVAALCCSQSFAAQGSGSQRTGALKDRGGNSLAQAPMEEGRPRQDQASQPPQTTTSQSYPREQVQTGQSLFAVQCGFCHGRDAAGGEIGPDLTISELVEKDVGGNEIGPVIRSGRTDKGMPPFDLADADLAAIVAFIHDQKIKMASKQGRRRTVQPEDLQSGNADEGKQYFNGAGGCSKCHSPSADLAGVANRLRGLALLRRMLYPGANRSANPAAAAATVTVTLPSGQTVTGKLAYRDEFVIGLTDSSGWYRSWFQSRVKFAVNNPLQAHIEQLGKYTDDTMHNVLAYLQTLH